MLTLSLSHRSPSLAATKPELEHALDALRRFLSKRTPKGKRSAGDAVALRLRLANGEPMSLEESLLVHRYCPGVLQHDYAVQPLRETLEREYGLRLVYAKQVIHAIPAPARLANLLEIQPKSPLLFIERVSYSQGGIPIEFLRISYRADRYSLYNELHE